MTKITTIIFILMYSITFSQSVATYNITFTNYWNANDHNNGNALPSNAHWSDLVGVNHNNNVTFLEIGGTATTGVENIAEIGNSSTFQSVDVQNAINANHAQQFFNAGDLFLSSGSSTIVYNGLEVNENYSLLTMLTMIAPSPDWMVAINSINLREGNTWKPEINIDLFPYDAGTEEGTTYSLTNAATNPQETISDIRGVSPFNTEKVAQLTITLQSVLSTNKANAFSNLALYPNPAKNSISISNIQNSKIHTITFYNVFGKQVKQIKNILSIKQLDIDISNLTSGLYALKFESKNGGVASKKLLIN
ncbi:spondin domain-containing protein [Algibacter sp. PT7-4]|uniref:T9SS type A sorting domain-containing protein n=1 Tax=Algibacter ulvanivorans TaxID=3400999 RepID=UPI003AAA4A54